MKAYSVDLRERVLAALERGMARTEVVKTFKVSLASLKRWLAAQRNTGDFTPRPPIGGSQPTINPTQDEELRAHVLAFSDATLAEHAAKWNTSHTTNLSRWTLGRAIRRLHLPRKKSR